MSGIKDFLEEITPTVKTDVNFDTKQVVTIALFVGIIIAILILIVKMK